ncbi:hypothetical protein ACFP51_08415 [Streptomyces pratens]|uniref:Uncharacterized protein n=1 Tax=Streptomyces pratens TaxID=887456 RepID=A0ABW1LS80_9ACTN
MSNSVLNALTNVSPNVSPNAPADSSWTGTADLDVTARHDERERADVGAPSPPVTTAPASPPPTSEPPHSPSFSAGLESAGSG